MVPSVPRKKSCMLGTLQARWFLRFPFLLFDVFVFRDCTVARRGVLWLVTSSRLALGRGPEAAARLEGLLGGISESISMLLLLLLLL
jgi:hypothetical protein